MKARLQRSSVVRHFHFVQLSPRFTTTKVVYFVSFHLCEQDEHRRPYLGIPSEAPDSLSDRLRATFYTCFYSITNIMVSEITNGAMLLREAFALLTISIMNNCLVMLNRCVSGNFIYVCRGLLEHYIYATSNLSITTHQTLLHCQGSRPVVSPTNVTQ